MGWLPWKKKKSQLEERDRQRNVPPVKAAAEGHGKGEGDGNTGTPAAAEGVGPGKSPEPSKKKEIGGPATPQKILLDDAILTPCYRGEVDKVKDLLTGKYGQVWPCLGCFVAASASTSSSLKHPAVPTVQD